MNLSAGMLIGFCARVSAWIMLKAGLSGPIIVFAARLLGTAIGPGNGMSIGLGNGYDCEVVT